MLNLVNILNKIIKRDFTVNLNYLENVVSSQKSCLGFGKIECSSE